LWGAATRLLALLRYPYPHDGLEGTLLHEARLLWSGQPLYQPLTRARFVSAPYPPLHPLLLGLADQFAGPHVFWSGRMLSLAAALGVAALIVLIARRVGGTWLGGLLGASLFLSAPPVILWATRVKPDLTALLWTALGLYLATHLLDRQGDKETRRQEDKETFYRSSSPSPLLPFSLSPFLLPLLVATCFALAFFTKQTDVMAPLGTGLALLIADLRAFYSMGERAGYIWRLPMRWRTLAYGLSYFVLALGTWALLDLATAGQYTAHVWGLHRSEWWSAVLLGKFVALLAPYLPAIVLALLVLIRAIRTGRALVPACYALVVPISLLGAGETGANHNHLLECLLALALTTGIAAGWMAELLKFPANGREDTRGVVGNARSAWLLSGAILVLLAGQIGLAYRPQPWYTGELAPDDPPERYLAFIRAAPGEVLADDMGLLYAAGRPLRYDDPSTMGPAAKSGVWDQSGLIQEIAERRFSAIVLPLNLDRDSVDATGRWTPEMLAAIRAHYKLAFRDTMFTYVPR
jgi:4-amino-4-deoxy-L-arabinose transferase-like glycosyltransferase